MEMGPKTKCQKCLEPTSFQVKAFECRGPLNAYKWNRLVLSCRISNVKMLMPDVTWSGNKNRTEYKAGNTAKGWFIGGQYIGAVIVFPFSVALAPRKANFLKPKYWPQTNQLFGVLPGEPWNQKTIWMVTIFRFFIKSPEEGNIGKLHVAFIFAVLLFLCLWWSKAQPSTQVTSYSVFFCIIGRGNIKLSKLTTLIMITHLRKYTTTDTHLASVHIDPTSSRQKLQVAAPRMIINLVVFRLLLHWGSSSITIYNTPIGRIFSILSINFIIRQFYLIR